MPNMPALYQNSNIILHNTRSKTSLSFPSVSAVAPLSSLFTLCFCLFVSPLSFPQISYRIYLSLPLSLSLSLSLSSLLSLYYIGSLQSLSLYFIQILSNLSLSLALSLLFRFPTISLSPSHFMTECSLPLPPPPLSLSLSLCLLQFIFLYTLPSDIFLHAHVTIPLALLFSMIWLFLNGLTLALFIPSHSHNPFSSSPSLFL